MRPRRDRLAILYLVLAALWSAALVLLASLYAVSGSSTSVVTTTDHSYTLTSLPQTLVQENGLKVLIPVGVPLMAVVVVALALRRRRTRGLFGPGPLALVATSIVGALSLVGMLTIGPFILPVAGLLVLACTRAPARGSTVEVKKGVA